MWKYSCIHILDLKDSRVSSTCFGSGLWDSDSQCRDISQALKAPRLQNSHTKKFWPETETSILYQYSKSSQEQQRLASMPHHSELQFRLTIAPNLKGPWRPLYGGYTHQQNSCKTKNLFMCLQSPVTKAMNANCALCCGPILPFFHTDKLYQLVDIICPCGKMVK